MVPLAKKLGYCGILIDNEAWDAVANFKPWPEYDSGVIDLVTFLDEKNQNISKDKIDSVDGGYIWINLKNNPTDG